MNERIRKLYDQANSRYTNDYALSGKPREEWRSIPDLFAELIVRECTSICAKQAWESRTNDDWTEYNALSRVAGQIKQHFGVEE